MNGRGSAHWSPLSLVPHLIGPLSHWFPIPLVPQLISPPSHCSPISTHASPIPFVSHLIGPPRLIGPPSQWSPISMVPHLIGPTSHWSPNATLITQFSLVPHPIGPPMRPWLHSSHWSPIPLVPQCDLGNTVLIGPPSHWSPNVTLNIQFSLIVPHLIGPPMRPWLHSSHWSPNATSVIQFSLVPHLIGPPMLPWFHSYHCSSISLVLECDPDYTVLIGSPSHWSPSVNRVGRVIRGGGTNIRMGPWSSNNAAGTYELGNQPVRRDQWDGEPMRWGTIGIGRKWVD